MVVQKDFSWQKGIAQILVTIGLAIIVLAIPAAVKLVEQRQEARKEAREVECVNDSECGQGFKCINYQCVETAPPPPPAPPCVPDCTGAACGEDNGCGGVCTNNCPPPPPPPPPPPAVQKFHYAWQADDSCAQVAGEGADECQPGQTKPPPAPPPPPPAPVSPLPGDWQSWRCPGPNCDKCGQLGWWGAGCDEFCLGGKCQPGEGPLTACGSVSKQCQGAERDLGTKCGSETGFKEIMVRCGNDGCLYENPTGQTCQPPPPPPAPAPAVEKSEAERREEAIEDYVRKECQEKHGEKERLVESCTRRRKEQLKKELAEEALHFEKQKKNARDFCEELAQDAYDHKRFFDGCVDDFQQDILEGKNVDPDIGGIYLAPESVKKIGCRGVEVFSDEPYNYYDCRTGERRVLGAVEQILCQTPQGLVPYETCQSFRSQVERDCQREIQEGNERGWECMGKTAQRIKTERGTETARRERELGKRGEYCAVGGGRVQGMAACLAEAGEKIEAGYSLEADAQGKPTGNIYLESGNALRFCSQNNYPAAIQDDFGNYYSCLAGIKITEEEFFKKMALPPPLRPSLCAGKADGLQLIKGACYYCYQETGNSVQADLCETFVPATGTVTPTLQLPATTTMVPLDRVGNNVACYLNGSCPNTTGVSSYFAITQDSIDKFNKLKLYKNMPDGEFEQTILEGNILPGSAMTDIKVIIKNGRYAIWMRLHADPGQIQQDYRIYASGSVSDLPALPGTQTPRQTVSQTPAKSEGKIVFVRDGKIYIMNANGTSQRRLTTGDAKEGTPSWSADGTKIIFDRDDGDIYVINADGNGLKRLTTDSAWDGTASWSLDGQKIIFASKRNGKEEIYIMNADGSNQQRLTVNTAEDWGPRWSPDGQKLVFVSERDGNEEIYVMNVDGSGQTRLTNNPAFDAIPSWSPDGKRIVFHSSRDGNFEIYVMDTDGKNQVRLTNNPAGDWNPAWSADGTKIIFASNRNGNTQIYVMNHDGSNLKRLTENPFEEGNPAWLPSGVEPTIPTPPRPQTPTIPSTGAKVYQPFTVNRASKDKIPPVNQPDINPLRKDLRGYELVKTITNIDDPAAHGLIDYKPGRNFDPRAPKLNTLIRDYPDYTFSNLYEIYDWNWPSGGGRPNNIGTRGKLETNVYPVNLVGLAVKPGETVQLPHTGIYSNGVFQNPNNMGNGYAALVIYVCPDGSCITLQSVPDDFIGARGYTYHLEDISVNPGLIALYNQLDQTARKQLPALKPGEEIGKTTGSELKVALRDTGVLKDPRDISFWVGQTTKAPTIKIPVGPQSYLEVPQNLWQQVLELVGGSLEKAKEAVQSIFKKKQLQTMTHTDGYLPMDTFRVY